MKQSLHHCFQSFGVKCIKIFAAKCFFNENAKMLKSKLYMGINLESFHTQNQIFTKITGWHMEDMEDLASAHYSAWLRKRHASAWTTMFLALLMCVPTFSLSCENPHSFTVWEDPFSFLTGQHSAFFTKTLQKICIV